MNGLTRKIHHFGDSYGVTSNSINFVNEMANTLGLNYSNYCVSGMSNELIFQRIIESTPKFKKDDIIFINFSFFSRGSYWNEYTQSILSTNTLYNEIDEQIQSKKYFDYTHNTEKSLFLLDYYLKYGEDYNRRLFNLISKFFESVLRNYRIYYIFIDDSDYVNQLLNYGFNIKFDGGFSKWLFVNGFHNLNGDGDGHYINGVQYDISKIILEKTNNLDKPII